jgi:hypothetical protein
MMGGEMEDLNAIADTSTRPPRPRAKATSPRDACRTAARST